MVPIDVPTISLVNGTIATSKIINGNERTIFITLFIKLHNNLFLIKWTISKSIYITIRYNPFIYF